MDKHKIVAIIQARITSVRLHGKILMDIEGKSMLWHVVSRLKFSKKLNDIILAIPDSKENDVLEKFARDNKLNYFRGSEENVLSRYYEAAKKFKCDLIVRITSDCPLIDPKIVDLVIEKHLNSEADYTSNFYNYTSKTLKRTFPRGLDAEVFSFKILEKAHKKAKKNHQQEHVTPYIYEHPELFSFQLVEAKEKLKHPEFRLTVDTKEDLELIREIYKRLYRSGKIFYIQEVVNLFKKCPRLLQINSNIQQKVLR